MRSLYVLIEDGFIFFLLAWSNIWLSVLFDESLGKPKTTPYVTDHQYLKKKSPIVLPPFPPRRQNLHPLSVQGRDWNLSNAPVWTTHTHVMVSVHGNTKGCSSSRRRTFTMPEISPSVMMRTAFLSPLAKASMAPMWAMNRSSRSVDSRRTFASKFRPPGCRPPCSTMTWTGWDTKEWPGACITVLQIVQ